MTKSDEVISAEQRLIRVAMDVTALGGVEPESALALAAANLRMALSPLPTREEMEGVDARHAGGHRGHVSVASVEASGVFWMRWLAENQPNASSGELKYWADILEAR